MKEWAEHELNIICGMPGIYIRIIYIYRHMFFYNIYIYTIHISLRFQGDTRYLFFKLAN